MTTALLITFFGSLILVRTLPRSLAVPFFWIGAWALFSVISMPFVHLVYMLVDAAGWHR